MAHRTFRSSTPLLASLSLMLALPLFAAGPVEIAPKPGIDPERMRVVNGVLSSEYPTVGVILEGTRDNNYMFCSGTLIGCNTFLTAAHCLCANLAYCDDHDVSTGFVYFPNGGVYGVSAVHIHPDFNFPVADVAVVTLSEPVTGITPSRINEVGPVPFETTGTVVGYGLSERGVNGVKRAGKIRTEGCTFPISNDDSVCWRYMAPLGDPGEDSSICFGDSGGPLFVDMAAQGSTQSNVVVAGIASGSNNGCSPIPEEKVIETNVYTYREFIQSVAGDDLGTASCGDLPPVGTPETLVESEWGELTILENEAVREFHVPPDIDLLRVTMNATDWAYQQILFTVNHGAPADAPEANCAHDEWSTWLSCEFVNPQAGTWYAKLRALAEGAEFQVTATMFGNRPNSGKMRVEIDPHTDAVAPGGVLPYTVEIRNVTDQAQTTSALWRVKSPNGNTYPYGPIPLSLAPGQTWTHTGRIDFGEVGPAGPGWMSIETTGPDGSFDRDWTTYRMQKDHAVAVKLSSPDAVVRPGGEWPYTVELQNVLGRRFRASTTWKITDPEGHESVYGPYDIGLAAGQTWKRELTLGYFPQEPLGLWTVTVETTAQGFVDRGSLDVELLPFGVASFERIEGVWDARAITSDGRIVVGNLDFGQNAYLWTEETGVVPIPEGLSAEDVSDDGSVVLGHMTESTTIGPMAFAGRWTETMGWQKLPPLDENYALCGGGWTSGYDMTPDGNVVVGLTWHDGCHAVAFRWTEESGMVAMPLTGSGARANAVSDDGTVVAGFDHHPDYGIRRGAVWTADDPSNPQTSFTESIAPSVWDEDPLNGPGELMSMTPDAKLFGGTSHIALTGAPECPYPGGYLWNRLTGELNNVFGLRGCWATYPLAISADGAIAVGSSGPYTAPVLLGTIWTEDTGLVLLQNFIERLGASIGDVSYLGPATDISNDGKKIVGLTPGEGAWIITLPGAADPAASMRAGLGEVVVSGGVPVHLPVGKKASGAGGEVEVLETNKPVGVVQIEKK